MAAPMGEVHKNHASQIQFGTNLELEALHHIQFLKRVNDAKYLKETSVLKRAIYRYEKYWLPLAADYPAECLSAPLGISWVWHCHMLCPVAYERDCISIVNRPINHVLRDPRDFQAAQLRSQSYWSMKYQHDHEPFHVDYTAPYDNRAIDSFQSKLSYDILSAAQRQMAFFYQVSLPHYQDPIFLRSAIIRYRMFIYLKMQLPNAFLVPCYDIDLMWHTHQLCPFVYKNDMYRLLGKILNHDDSTTDRSPGSKLSNATTETRQHWINFYNESFTLFGAMYRGKPPAGILYKITPEQIMLISSKRCSITFDSIALSLEQSSPKQQKNIRLYAYRGNNIIQQDKMLKLKRPKNSPLGSSQIVWTEIKRIHDFSCKTSNNIKFTLAEKTGLCPGPKIIHGSNFIHILHHIDAEQNLQNGGKFHERIQIGQGMSLEVIGNTSRPVRAGVLLTIQKGDYQFATVPENIQELWGPVSLERLPQGIDNRCQVASHSLYSNAGKREFTVRTIHSAPLVMSVVQVFYHDKMSAIAHLIASDQLPLPTQINTMGERIISLNPKQGERAILIKNSEGDWGIVTGRWDGFRQGIEPGGNVGKGQRGSPGTLLIKFYNLVTKRSPQTLTLGYIKNEYDFNLASSDVDLQSGSISIDPNCDDVAENIALAFSVSLLHVLCVPRPKGWKEGQQVKPPPLKRGYRDVRGIPSDDMTLILAAGLLISAPSNYYFHTLHGENMCAMCGGGAIGYNINDPRLPSSEHGYGHNGSGCASACTVYGHSAGCGGCQGACSSCGAGGCGGCGGGCGGCGGCGGGCGGCG